MAKCTVTTRASTDKNTKTLVLLAISLIFLGAANLSLEKGFTVVYKMINFVVVFCGTHLFEFTRVHLF